MPIRINLLAEAQALEEMRRRDPVKRAIVFGALFGTAILVYAGYLQTKAIVAKSEVNRLEGQLRAKSTDYQQVIENRKKLDDAMQKLTKLQELATNRFLNGTVLDALQHTTVDDVQLVHLKTDHVYVPAEETKPKTNANGHITPGKPPSVTEKVILTLEAKDGSGGEQAIKYKQAISDCSYFQAVLGKTNEVRLTNLSPNQTGADGKSFVQFTLECRYPEKVMK